VVLSEDDATKDAEKMPSDTRVASRDISVRIIRDAGHNLQIDNPTGFVSAILDSVR
jgi:pimeloyl-ACP methyl ester carboxylesterase